MNRYYYACDASSFDRHLKDVDVLVSAGLCWKKEGCCGAGRLAVPKYLDGARSIMIDSGAYSFKEYPFSLEEYVEWVFEFWDTYPQLGYAATPDFIIPRSMDESERRNQIEESLENGWDLMRDCVHPWKQDDIQWIFTIQGSTLADYQHAVQYIWDCEEEGTGGWNYHMAVGSLKGQNDVDEIYRILRHVRENIHSYCSLHAFGLTYQVLMERARQLDREEGLPEKPLQVPPGHEICPDCGREMVWDDPHREMLVLVCPACLYRSLREAEQELKRLRKKRAS